MTDSYRLVHISDTHFAAATEIDPIPPSTWKLNWLRNTTNTFLKRPPAQPLHHGTFDRSPILKFTQWLDAASKTNRGKLVLLHTGDVAAFGNKEDMDVARTTLTDLARRTHRKEALVVLGNHDFYDVQGYPRVANSWPNDDSGSGSQYSIPSWCTLQWLPEGDTTAGALRLALITLDLSVDLCDASPNLRWASRQKESLVGNLNEQRVKELLCMLDEVKATGARTLLLCHYPLTSPGREQNSGKGQTKHWLPMWPVLGENLIKQVTTMNVDIILNGHLHAATASFAMPVADQEVLPLLLGAPSLSASDARGRHGFSEVNVLFDHTAKRVSYSVSRYQYNQDRSRFDLIPDQYLGVSVQC